jgi:hypothetical protein
MSNHILDRMMVRWKWVRKMSEAKDMSKSTWKLYRNRTKAKYIYTQKSF